MLYVQDGALGISTKHMMLVTVMRIRVMAVAQASSCVYTERDVGP
jgi:hypothetical protein